MLVWLQNFAMALRYKAYQYRAMAKRLRARQDQSPNTSHPSKPTGWSQQCWIDSLNSRR